MNKPDLDKNDLLIAGGAAAFVFGLACLWAYPYPHPDLWPTVSQFRFHVSIGPLGVLGRLALGAYAGLFYLLLRVLWLDNLHTDDEVKGCLSYVRVSSLLGALLFSTLPAIWRAAQFLSPACLLTVVELLGVLGWQCSRGRERYLTYFASYLLIAFVAAFNPIALAFLLALVVLDVIGRWQRGLDHGQQEDDYKVRREAAREMFVSIIAVLAGFIGGVIVLARTIALSDFTWNSLKILSDWLHAWLPAFDASIVSPFMLTLAGITVFVLVAVALVRRVRSVSDYGRTMAIVILCVQGLVSVIFMVRASDGDARMRLGVIRDFVHEVVCDAWDVRWFFSDGRFDDMLRYEFKKAGRPVYVMDVMHAPSAAEGKRMRKMAPTLGERDLYEAGGAEVFRAWAREYPERLQESAWFTGGGVLKLFHKITQRTCGSVMRAQPAEGGTEAFDAADARQAVFMQRALEAASSESLWRRVFGSVDGVLAEKFDSVLWRVARQASARVARYEANGDVTRATELSAKVRTLNSRNGTLSALGEKIEQLLQTANLVPTPREALEIALKRADFLLAQRYANEVLQTTPDDPQANFALGMVNLQAKEYFLATRSFERVLKTKPNEPAVLNNLSLAYLKLGQNERALAYAERALKAQPNSKEIQSSLAAIKKAMGK